MSGRRSDPRRLCRAALLGAAALALSGPAQTGAHAVPPRTAGLSAAAPGAQLQLDFPLAADDAGLQAFARAVSTPGSPLYGDYASVPTLARRFGAAPGVVAAVVGYLRRAGARDVALSATGMFVQATMSASAAERLSGVRLAGLRAGDGARVLAPAPDAPGAAAAPRLPAALRGLVTGVVGLDNQRLLSPLGGPAAAGAHQRTSAYLPRTGTARGCRAGRASRGFTPNQYLTAYGHDVLQRSGLRGAGVRAALIEIDGFRGSDVQRFARCFGIHLPRIHVFADGLHRPLVPGGEATLDIELLSAAAPRLSSLDVYEDPGDAAHVLRAFAAPLISPAAKAQVVSVSLGICEPFARATLGPAGLQAVERDLELATAAGITMLVSAGDQGSSACVSPNGRVQSQLAVSYPASSPFATAVGGTNVELDRSNHVASELVWNDTDVTPAAGGGGYSGIFDRPSWQDGVVRARTRVLPDVAMLADLAPGYAVYCTATRDRECHGWSAVGGTSAATPLLAGGLALIDQDLRRHHQRDLGLVNPLLYRLGSAGVAGVFRDVTSIGNDLGPWLRGARRPLGCCTARRGFDAASGWGSVNVAALDAAARELVPAAPTFSHSPIKAVLPVRP